MKIIILDHEPFSTRKNNHFFIQEFRNKGIEVEFWSLWKLLSYSKKLSYTTALEGDKVYYIKTKKEFFHKLSLLNPNETFIFTEFWFNSQTLFIFKLLIRFSFSWGRLEYYNNPTVNFYQLTEKPAPISKVAKFRSLMSRLFMSGYVSFHYLKKFNKPYFLKLMTSDISFITGSYLHNFTPSKKFVSIDYFDVAIYHEELLKKPILDYPYIVFADIFLGKHPDLQIHHGTSYMDIDQYHDKLNNFFSTLEEKLKMPVVIAAHPKSSYTHEFKGRLVIKNETANLIINSKLVIQHASLSISYALLGKKKIIQFYDTTFLNHNVLQRFYKIMENTSMQAGNPCINIDSEHNYVALYEEAVDPKRYEEILNLYFLKENSSLTNFDIVHKNIVQILLQKNNYVDV